MGLLNFTIQVSSPLIVYSGDWRQGINTDAHNGSFRTTTAGGSYATLTFVGTGVTIFGSMGENHGNYSVSIDGDAPFIASGFATSPSFNLPLWSINGLDYGSHTVNMTNRPAGLNHTLLDIDYIDTERHLGQPQDPISRTLIDDHSPFATYAGPWVSLPVGTAKNGSVHRTTSSGAKVTLDFQGCCIEVYGQYANAPYTVLLDDQTPQWFAGLDVTVDDADQAPGALLYLMDSLSEDRNHSLTLTNLDANERRPFYFDYAIATSTRNINVTAPSSSSKSGIIGGVIGGLVSVGLLVILYVLKKWRDHTSFRRLLSRQKLEPYVIPKYPTPPSPAATLGHSSPPKASSDAVRLKVFRTVFQPLVFPGTGSKGGKAREKQYGREKPLPPRPPSLLQ